MDEILSWALTLFVVAGALAIGVMALCFFPAYCFLEEAVNVSQRS